MRDEDSAKGSFGRREGKGRECRGGEGLETIWWAGEEVRTRKIRRRGTRRSRGAQVVRGGGRAVGIGGGAEESAGVEGDGVFGGLEVG